MCDKFFENVGVPEDALFSSSLNLIHQIGEKVEGAFVSHFVLTQFLRKFANDNPKVLVVSTHHTKSHWVSIASKFGTNLTSLEEKGVVTVIDLLKEVYDSLRTNTPQEDGNDTGSPGESCPLCLKNLYKRCESYIQNFRDGGSKRILVIVEDVAVFLQNVKVNTDNFQASERNVMEFIVKLKSLSILSKEKDQSCITITSLVQSPESVLEFPEMSRFAKSMSLGLPSIVFEVSPLSTGFSSQVSGYLKVVCNLKDGWQGGKEPVTPFVRNYHFKLESNNVRVVPL